VRASSAACVIVSLAVTMASEVVPTKVGPLVLDVGRESKALHSASAAIIALAIAARTQVDVVRTAIRVRAPAQLE
jgi:hypothetical protein